MLSVSGVKGKPFSETPYTNQTAFMSTPTNKGVARPFKARLASICEMPPKQSYFEIVKTPSEQPIPVRITNRYAKDYRIPSPNRSNVKFNSPSPKLMKSGSRNVFVPSIILSNVMPLVPKIDEVRSVATTANPDIICITESWLREHIQDNIVSSSNYTLVRRDRVERLHGSVCTYIRKIIQFKILEDLSSENLEVIWFQLNLRRLPRGISSIILGILYHPPNADNSMMLNYLYECLVSVETQFPRSGIIILGDFNQLKTSRLQNSFKLKQLVKFPTRGQNILDLIMTNIGSYYQKPKKLSPFGLSDHATIEIQPLSRSEFPKVSIKTKSRDLRVTNRLALRRYL